MSSSYRTTKDELIRKRSIAELAKTSSANPTSRKAHSITPSQAPLVASGPLSPAAPSRGRSSKVNTAAAGTVASLGPLPPVVVSKNARITEAAQIMASSKRDALLVVDGTQHSLFGILTDKDIVFRVLALGKSPGDVRVEQVATRNVKFAKATDLAHDALATMLEGGFRHLPIICADEDDGEGGDGASQDILGVLDIARCLGVALGFIERMKRDTSLQTAALAAAFQEKMNHLESEKRGGSTGALSVGCDTYNDDAESTVAATDISKRIVIEELLETMNNTILTPSVASTMVEVTNDTLVVPHVTTVFQAIEIMAKNKSTAVLAATQSTVSGVRYRQLEGIMTTKDVVLRVVAAREDPYGMPVARAMTPKPKTITSNTTIGDALKIISNARFLHLPVVSHEQQGVPVGLIDVIKLTQDVLKHTNKVFDGASGSTSTSASPMAALLSSYAMPLSAQSSSSTCSEWPSSNSTSSECGEYNYNQGPRSVTPSTPAPWENIEGMADSGAHNMTKFMFKVLVVSSGTYIQIQACDDDLVSLKATLQRRIRNPAEAVASLSYIDAEGDSCTLETDEDLVTAVQLAREAGYRRVILHMHTKHLGRKVPEASSGETDILKVNKPKFKKIESETTATLASANSGLFVAAVSAGILSVALAASIGFILMRQYAK